MNTLDITSYFKSPEKSDSGRNNSNDKIEFANDDFDELVGKMDLDII